MMCGVFAKAIIRETILTILSQHDIFRLNVAVDDVWTMAERHALDHLVGEVAQSFSLQAKDAQAIQNQSASQKAVRAHESV